MKPKKPQYETTTACDSTTTSSQYEFDMKKIVLPEYYILSSGFPIVAKDFTSAIVIARNISRQDSNSGQIIRVFCLSMGKMLIGFTNGEQVTDEDNKG